MLLIDAEDELKRHKSCANLMQKSEASGVENETF